MASSPAVMAAFNERGIELVMDWEHATQRRAVNGDEAPAAAWHPELEIREGALVARAAGALPGLHRAP